MSSQPARILVFSEHQEALEFLVQNLEALGHQVSFAVNEDEVLQAVKCADESQPAVLTLTDPVAPNFDLLLLDANRPALIKKVKDQKEYHDIPILVLIAEDEMSLAEECIALGARDYLRDPLNPLLLKVRVEASLEEKFARDRQKERETLIKIEHDLQIAQQIQLSFLASELPVFQDWEVASRFYPARTVAGDWYDSFYLANHRRLGIVIADVCDKGLPSALFMALGRSLVRAFAQQNYTMRWADNALASLGDGDDSTQDVGADLVTARPASARLLPAMEPRSARVLPSAGTTALKTAVQLTNNYILENHGPANMFFTLFFGVIDPLTGALAYVNAGHNPPFIVTKDGQIRGRLKPTGPAVGIFPDAEFGIGYSDLQPGDILFTFTDGVPDAHSPTGKMFSDKRILELAATPVSSAKELLDRIDRAVHDHIAEAVQFDDITMIAARYQLPEEP
jgi:phosphoserine phosphatase RsbU/P